MKKGKILVVGLIGLLLAFGLVLAGCGDKCSEKGDCVVTSDSSGDVILAKKCDNNKCAVSKLAGTEAKPNMNVRCDCK